jgi:hypothetical protein
MNTPSSVPVSAIHFAVTIGPTTYTTSSGWTSSTDTLTGGSDTITITYNNIAGQPNVVSGDTFTISITQTSNPAAVFDGYTGYTLLMSIPGYATGSVSTTVS